MTTYVRKSNTYEAWQFKAAELNSEQTQAFPSWVMELATSGALLQPAANGDFLKLNNDGGIEHINNGDWLVRDHVGSLSVVPDHEFQKKFEART